MKNPNVEFFFEKAGQWKEAVEELRNIILGCGLPEELKWGVPCYTEKGSNVVLIHYFKDYCALLFHKGVLLKDEKRYLIQQTKNVQAARQLRFKSLEEIKEKKALIKAYVYEAVEVERAGLKVKMKSTKEFDVPEEFQLLLDEKPALKRAFEALSPGRQRGYLLYFSGAKQAKTRIARIEKYIPQIMKGKGLND
jgi:uncharacterized protein YdeI (YjbR/CyaY-like superfamily)